MAVSKPIKTGILSGSFNPIHTGHLILAQYMAEYEGLDEVWFVVSPQNPTLNAICQYHHTQSIR